MTRYCYRLTGLARRNRVVTVERIDGVGTFDPRGNEAWLRVALAKMRAVPVEDGFSWFSFREVDAEGFIVPLAKGTHHELGGEGG